MQRVARVDLESPFCNAIIHSQAYLPAELSLAKLEALSDTEPACMAQASAAYRYVTTHHTHCLNTASLLPFPARVFLHSSP